VGFEEGSAILEVLNFGNGDSVFVDSRTVFGGGGYQRLTRLLRRVSKP